MIGFNFKLQSVLCKRYWISFELSSLVFDFLFNKVQIRHYSFPPKVSRIDVVIFKKLSFSNINLPYNAVSCFFKSHQIDADYFRWKTVVWCFEAALAHYISLKFHTRFFFKILRLPKNFHVLHYTFLHSHIFLRLVLFVYS